MRLKSKQIKSLLKKFEINFPNNAKIKIIKQTNPTPITSLCEFLFLNDDWMILVDENADDNENQIMSQISWPKTEIILLQNPNLKTSFAMPFQQKTCYLIKRKQLTIRLDKILSEQNPDISRSKIKKLIEDSNVKVNNKIETSASKKINPDLDKIKLKVPDKEVAKLPKIDIIFEDENIIAVNKPAGILTHPIDPENITEETLADLIKDKTNNFDKPDYRSGIVHRLDRATSGIILLAKNQQTQDFLKNQFQNRQIQKTYYAISKGKVKHQQAKINLPLKRSLKQPGKFMVDVNGKEAISNYEIIKSKDNINLIKIKPKTGRTHQIRVHLAYINLPIVGDYLYGGQKNDRLMLHAESIIFNNLDNQKIELSATLPEEFDKWI